jgi:hypothetical protein
MSYEKELSLDLLDLKIKDENGIEETMNNGSFQSFVIQPNIEYTIQWKFKNSDQWNSFKKRSILPDTNQINPSNVEVNDDISIKIQSNLNHSVFYSALKINYRNGQINNTLLKAAEQIGFSNLTIDKQNFLEAEVNNNKIRLYPPKNRSEFPGQGVSNCIKPFHYVSAPKYEEFSLFEMSARDFDLLYQINLNGIKSTEPLYIGEPLAIDYSNNEMLAHVFFIHPYNNIVFKDYLPKNGIVTYEITKNSLPLDTTLYTDAKLLFTFENSKVYSYPYSNTARSGIVFFKDKIADDYNTKFSQSCGFYKTSYVLNLYVVYKEKLTGKIILYPLPNQYVYSYQSDHLIIDIP